MRRAAWLGLALLLGCVDGTDDLDGRLGPGADAGVVVDAPDAGALASDAGVPPDASRVVYVVMEELDGRVEHSMVELRPGGFRQQALGGFELDRVPWSASLGPSGDRLVYGVGDDLFLLAIRPDFTVGSEPASRGGRFAPWFWSPRGDRLTAGTGAVGAVFRDDGEGRATFSERLRSRTVYLGRWSASGGAVVHQGVDGRTVVTDTETLETVAEFDTVGAVTAAWAGDTLFSLEDVGLVRRDAEGRGPPVQVEPVLEGEARAPLLYHRSASPDGTMLVVAGRTLNGDRIDVLDVASGTFELAGTTFGNFSAVLWRPDGRGFVVALDQGTRIWRYVHVADGPPYRGVSFELEDPGYSGGRFPFEFATPSQATIRAENGLYLVDLDADPPRAERLAETGVTPLHTYGEGLVYAEREGARAAQVIRPDGTRTTVDLSPGETLPRDLRQAVLTSTRLLLPVRSSEGLRIPVVELTGPRPSTLQAARLNERPLRALRVAAQDRLSP